MKILSVLDRSVCGFFRAFVRFIDVGKEEEVKCYQILQLPEKFHSLPAQAVEIIVCSVKPGDAEINWHPKVISKPVYLSLLENKSLFVMVFTGVCNKHLISSNMMTFSAPFTHQLVHLTLLVEWLVALWCFAVSKQVKNVI